MRLVLYVAALAVFAFITWGCGAPPANQTASSTPQGIPSGTSTIVASGSETSVETVDGGKEVYAANCMICHKDTGKGGKVTIGGKNLNADDLTSDKMKKKTDDKLVEHVTEGVPDEGMPAFKGKLDEKEIQAVVGHIRTLQASL